MSAHGANLAQIGPLVSGSTTDLASVVEMFDSLLERSRRGVAEPSPADSPDSPDSPESPDSPAAPMRPLQIVEERDDPDRKRDASGGGRAGRYTKRRPAEPRPLSISSTSSSSSSACSSLPRGRAWRLQPTEEDVQDSGKGDGLRKSASSGSGDSGLSSPLTFVASPTSPGAHRSHMYDPSLTYIERVVTEVVETEAVYVNDLRQILEGYLFYWRENPEPAIVDEYTDALFSNVQEIFRCNSVFLSALELCELDPSKVASSFVNHGSRFSVYIDYCTKYPRTVSVLTELMRRETTARLFRERQAALGHALPLGSYLLKPVQRILKYHLLLQNMKSHTDSHSDGYSAVCAALETMTALAGHINDMKRRHENAVRVQEIQSLLYGWQGEDLTTYGELVAEGAFRMHRAKASRHVFLFDRMVLITKRREDATLAYKAHIMCSNLMLIESIPGDPYSFHVVPFDNPRLQYTLQARSMEQKRDWALQLKRAILESYNAVIPYHARELVMQLGQDKAAGDFVRRNSSSKRQHSAPEYLERRRAYKRATSFNQKLRLRSRDRARKGSLDSRKDSVYAEDELERKNSTASCPDEKKGRRSLLSLRRKSEPFISLSSPRSAADAADSPPAELHCLPDVDEEGPAVDRSDGDDASSVLDDATDATDADDASECDVKDLLDVKPENLQSIVEQLVMQNMEFRRILNKPRRGLRRQNSAAKSEETDSECEVDDDDLSFSACVEEDAEPAEPSALAFHNHDNTEYVSFFDYNPDAAAPRLEPDAAEADRQSLQRTVSDPCRKVARKLGRFQGMGQSELLHFLGSIRKKSGARRLSRVEADRPPAAAAEEAAVRRAQSFNDNDELCAGPPRGGAALRRAPSSASDPVSRASLYLTPQLAKKADSLPGAFHRTGSLGRAPSVDFDAGRFLAPRAVQEDDRLTTYTTTPAASSESLDVHPEYRIYGPAVSQSSLRSMVGSFRARLTRLKQPARAGSGSGSGASSGASLGSLFGSPAGSQVDMRDQSRSRLLYIMAKSLKERVSSLVPDEAESDAESPRGLVAAPFAPGGAGLGARLARGPREGSASVGASPARPKTPPLPARSAAAAGAAPAGETSSSKQQSAASSRATRPDSMLSSSSVVTSSSVSSESTSGVATEASKTEESRSQSTSDGEGSVGSFYEHELDILEDIHGSELFRDSAIYSDHDELLDSIEATLPPRLDAAPPAKKVPPPVPAKPRAPLAVVETGETAEPDRLEAAEPDRFEAERLEAERAALELVAAVSIRERLRCLEESQQQLRQQRREECSSYPSAEALKAISERRRELEQWRCGGGRGGDESETSSQHSTSTINTVIEAASRGHSRSSSQEETLPRGWVKQVIGKLQGEASS